MKYSAYNGDLGDVTLDGVEIKHVFECDTDEGYVIVADLDSNGKIQIDGDEVKRVRREGVVTYTPWNGMRPK